ncbi:MAG: hypothetical protein JWP65_309 [Ramlibacter sp.]|nr:hypothetical protein [Ramlibacter sp.]
MCISYSTWPRPGTPGQAASVQSKACSSTASVGPWGRPVASGRLGRQWLHVVEVQSVAGARQHGRHQGAEVAAIFRGKWRRIEDGWAFEDHRHAAGGRRPDAEMRALPGAVLRARWQACPPRGCGPSPSSHRQATGNWQLATGNWQLATGCRSVACAVHKRDAPNEKGYVLLRRSPHVLVRLAGIEPTTPWFVAKYSIQLSYSREASEYSSKWPPAFALAPPIRLAGARRRLPTRGRAWLGGSWRT